MSELVDSARVGAAGAREEISSRRSELRSALSGCRGTFLGVAMFSGMSNLLMLTGAFFMLQVYDRVLPSRSVSTLLALGALVVVLLFAQGLIDIIRGRILTRVASDLDEKLSARIYGVVVRLPLKADTRGDGLQPMRELDAIRSFMSGQGPSALFDLPWIPIYLAIIFSFHTMLGWTALIGALVLGGLTLLTELMTRRPMIAATEAGAARNGFAQAGQRNAEVLAAMGMSTRVGARWELANREFMASNRKVSDIAGGFGSMSRALRMMLQSGVLAVGAFLVIHGQATGGIIIAGSILVARAMAPIDLAIANWRGLVAARQSWRRLNRLLALMPEQGALTELPSPCKSLTVSAVGVVPPGEHDSVVHEVSLQLNAGDGLGIIGDSGSGKSSLARALVGVWTPARGSVRLDGAALEQWPRDVLGRHIGYVPQDVELFDGTVAENIARFEADAPSDLVIEAARAAGVHDLIVTLPKGYDTELGANGKALSGGERQRVALARALYRDPFLLVLDEPNSNLDRDGEAALNHAIRGVRARGGIAIVIAHRKSALAEVDKLLVMARGTAVAFGGKEAVLARALRSVARQAPSVGSVLHNERLEA
jgi:ATP-binding cassette, subfamily C, type I secretion system permease/ATPase